MDQAQKLREMVSELQKRESPAKKAFTYCVTSGKGGVGKTSFTVNYALALANCGKKVAIIDADFGFSNVNIVMGVNSDYHLGHLISGQRALDEVMTQCYQNVWFISGGPGVEELMHVHPKRLEYVLAKLRPLETSMDYILFDTGAGMNDSILRLMDASDRSVIVLTSEPTSILDSYVVVKTAAKLADQPCLSVLVNRALSEGDAEETYRNFANTVLKYLKYDLEMLGFVVQDPKMTESISKLVPHLIKYPTSAASKQIQMIADNVTDTKHETSRYGIKGFFSRLIKGGQGA